MSNYTHECCLCTEQHLTSDMQVISVWENGVETLHQMGRACFTKAWYELAGLDHLQSQIRSITHQRNVYQKGYEVLLMQIKSYTEDMERTMDNGEETI